MVFLLHRKGLAVCELITVREKQDTAVERDAAVVLSNKVVVQTHQVAATVPDYLFRFESTQLQKNTYCSHFQIIPDQYFFVGCSLLLQGLFIKMTNFST